MGILIQNAKAPAMEARKKSLTQGNRGGGSKCSIILKRDPQAYPSRRSRHAGRMARSRGTLVEFYESYESVAGQACVVGF